MVEVWQKFWELIVTWVWEWLIRPNWRRQRQWRVRCSCWVSKNVRDYSLKTGKTKSCWCKMQDWATKAKIKHGMSWTDVYTTWLNMKARCNSPKHDMYYRYWWRWISVERKDFSEFWKDMWPSYVEWLSIERIDNDKNYCKENCTWIPKEEQAKNKSNTVRYKWTSLRDYCIQNWLKYKTVHMRYKRWRTLDEAVNWKRM
jgi:hypothetical protein